MYKLLIFTVVGLCSLMVAECNEDLFEGWKEFMAKSYCDTNDKTDKEKYLDCCTIFPEEMTNIILQETGKEKMAEAMDEICSNEEMGEKVCEAIKEKKDDLGMTEEITEKLMECMEK